MQGVSHFICPGCCLVSLALEYWQVDNCVIRLWYLRTVPLLGSLHNNNFSAFCSLLPFEGSDPSQSSFSHLCMWHGMSILNKVLPQETLNSTCAKYFCILVEITPLWPFMHAPCRENTLEMDVNQGRFIHPIRFLISKNVHSQYFFLIEQFVEQTGALIMVV